MEAQKIDLLVFSIILFNKRFLVCHEVFLPKRENRNQIVGYEEPENASYCLVMVRYGDPNNAVTVAALLESFVPVERTPNV